MSSTDAVSETFDAEDGQGFVDRAAALFETFGPHLDRHARSGNLAAASGVVSLARAGRTFLKGDRKRGLVRLLAGLFWVGVALAQRRGDSGESRSDSAASEVVDTSPDIEDVETGGSDREDHATGNEVVDTTDADIDESDTAPEESAEVEREVEDADVDQSDVVETAEVEDVAETGAETESESEETANEPEGESAE